MVPQSLTTIQNCAWLLVSIAGTIVNISITSAAGKSAHFQNLGTKLTVSPLADCPTSTCPGAAATSGNATRSAAAAPGAGAAAAAPAANAGGAASPATSSATAAQMSFGIVALGVLFTACGL